MAQRWWVSALVSLLYPRDYVARYGPELAAAMAAAYVRERQRGAGRLRILTHLFTDALRSAVLVRRDARRVVRARPLHSQGDPLMRTVLYELRFSVRALRRSPLFAVLIVAAFAIAIGANATIFSVVNGVLLRPLPYRDPSRLLLLHEGLAAVRERFGFSAPDYVAFRAGSRSYESMAAFRTVEYELSGVDRPERIPALRMSAALLDVLGVAPASGRAFTDAEEAARHPVALLSDGLWRRAFRADPSIVGRAIVLDRRPYTIIGVMPSSFVFPHRGTALNNVPAQVFVPMAFSDVELRAFGAMYNNSVVARLRPGITQSQAESEGAALAREIGARLYPPELREVGGALHVMVAPLHEAVTGNVKPVILLLLATVGVVLLIACADIACVLLARAGLRRRELALRTALGATRGRLVAATLLEIGVLAMAGGAAGLLLAWWAQRLILASPLPVRSAADIAIDARVVLFTTGISLLAALVCGVVPALGGAARQSGEALKDGDRLGTSSLRQRRLFSGLVIAQFACALVLLASGSLLMRSFAKLLATNPGIDGANVITAAVDLPAASYPSGAEVRSFYVRLVTALRQVPGVAQASAATDLPLSVRERRVFVIELPPPATAPLPRVIANDWVMGRYFESVGIHLLRGRTIGDEDTIGSEPVVVINETMARRYWPGEDALGRRIAWGNAQTHGPWMRIVGIVGDVKQAGLAAPTEPGTWQPWAQLPDGLIGGHVTGVFRGMKLMVRAHVPPSSLIPAIREQVGALDPSLPLTGIRTLDEVVGASAATQRFNAWVLGGFGLVALALASLGVGGVLAISVSRRAREIGVRVALGAHSRDVIAMIVREGLVLILAGLAIGLPCALAATRLLRTLLFDTAPHDPVAFTVAAAILSVVGLVACLAPAVRASRVDPLVALRVD